MMFRSSSNFRWHPHARDMAVKVVIWSYHTNDPMVPFSSFSRILLETVLFVPKYGCFADSVSDPIFVDKLAIGRLTSARWGSFRQ